MFIGGEAITAVPAPASSAERTHNPLRPEFLGQIIGQDDAKELMARAIRSAFTRKHPLPHTLLTGPAGAGKSTFSHAVANELGVQVYDVEAPVSYDTLAALRCEMLDGAVLRIEEIHQQAIMERRGRSSATQPEVLYALMEDRVLQSPSGPLDYPHITIIGTTTDQGMLPDSFVDRFILKPRLVRYTPRQMEAIGRSNCQALDLDADGNAIRVFSHACRGVPREMNNLVRTALLFTTPYEVCDTDVAFRVLRTLGITYDGLTADMQAMLTFLHTRAGRRSKGELIYQASVNTIATATGHSRDSKAIALRVEPYLIEQGYVQVTHGGRKLTDAGVIRAKELLQ